MAPRHGSATVTTPSEREILITRSFEAPATLVWQALTAPELLLRWWGPSWAPLVAAEVDLRVGGAWRYVCRTADGTELGWHGTYRDLLPGERIVTTEIFEGFPDAEAVNTMTLTEADGVTTLRTVVLHSSREHRDGHLESGMEAGMQETFDRLDTWCDDRDTPAERFRRVSAAFTDRVRQVPPSAWDDPSPCDGWNARDIVGHMVEWMPAFLGSVGAPLAPGPGVTADPVGAWTHVAHEVQRVLDDPTLASREFEHEHLGSDTIEHAIAMIMVGDVVIHTWDLARATGLDDTLPADIVHEMYEGMSAMGDALRVGGQFGPAVAVPADADEQTRLVALTGRTP
jgi:uncharacterized protein (TIGR03086 family)